MSSQPDSPVGPGEDSLGAEDPTGDGDGARHELREARGADPSDALEEALSADGAAGSVGQDPAYVDDSGELPLLVPARDRFAGLPAVPVTGDPRVDAATARLEEIVELPTEDHIEVYEDVHRRLQEALADADPH